MEERYNPIFFPWKDPGNITKPQGSWKHTVVTS